MAARVSAGQERQPDTRRVRPGSASRERGRGRGVWRRLGGVEAGGGAGQGGGEGGWWRLGGVGGVGPFRQGQGPVGAQYLLLLVGAGAASLPPSHPPSAAGPPSAFPGPSDPFTRLEQM